MALAHVKVKQELPEVLLSWYLTLLDSVFLQSFGPRSQLRGEGLQMPSAARTQPCRNLRRI